MNTNVQYGEERELHEKRSILNLVYPNARFWDVKELFDGNIDLAALFTSLKAATQVIFGWLKGSNLTYVTTEDENPLRWSDLLDAMNIGIDPNGQKLAKLPKRLARALSPRDVVAKTTFKALNMKIVSDLEMSRSKYESFTAKKRAMLLDGTGIIKMSFALRYGEAFGITPRKLNKCEALSISIITPEGMLKGLFYVVKDDNWGWGDNNVVCSAENLKGELFTTDGETVWLAYDVFGHHGDPNTNGLLDVAMGRMLYRADRRNMVAALSHVLEKAFQNIVNGTAVKALDQWMLPTPDAELDGRKANEDFAWLPSILHDWEARGLDYRESPTLVSMLVTAQENKWWNKARNWPKYPLICSWTRPVVCESAAALLGESIHVQRGEIRSIRGGRVWVVNDEDWMSYFAYNSGGADEDDHWFLIFRIVNGVKSVIACRTPNGWAEFNIMAYHEGDPFPTFVSATGTEISFPEIPGKVRETLSELVDSGQMTITGLPPAAPLQLPAKYGVDSIQIVADDIVANSSGYLGQVINRIVLVMGFNGGPNLLKSLPATLEEIIDTFTQGGAGMSRAHLSDWANDLVTQAATSGAPIDKELWARRAGKPKNLYPNLVTDFWSYWISDNLEARAEFKTKTNKWHGEYRKDHHSLVDQVAYVFGLNPVTVSAVTDNLVINHANGVIRAYSGRMGTLNEIARQRKEGQRQLTPEEWRELYELAYAEIEERCQGQDEWMQLLALATWLVAMTGTKPMTEKAIMNPVVYEKLFSKALVTFGLAADIDHLTNIAKLNIELADEDGMILDEDFNPTKVTLATGLEEAKVHQWFRTCKVCGTTYPTNDVQMYVQFFLGSQVCKNCK